jgi:hypothetical protein
MICAHNAVGRRAKVWSRKPMVWSDYSVGQPPARETMWNLNHSQL